MKFPPVFTLTDNIRSHLHELVVLKAAYQYIPFDTARMTRIRQESVLKSSLFSARIEGNPMTLADARMQLGSDNRDTHIVEVENINNALAMLESEQAAIDTELLRRFHAKVLQGISPEAGLLRSEESAIYNQAGIAVYLTPAPVSITPLLTGLCEWVNSSELSPPATAAVAHIWFEKIHPFLDGNGRVGRLLSQYILVRNGYGFTGVVPFEEYLDEHRQEYYDALSVDSEEVNSFVEFFLTALVSQTKRSLDAMKQTGSRTDVPGLLPRRSELVSVIREHRMVSFDFLARRFRAIPERTLHYDLLQLVKAGYVKKLGSTRGVLYAPAES